MTPIQPNSTQTILIRLRNGFNGAQPMNTSYLVVVWSFIYLFIFRIGCIFFFISYPLALQILLLILECKCNMFFVNHLYILPSVPRMIPKRGDNILMQLSFFYQIGIKTKESIHVSCMSVSFFPFHTTFVKNKWHLSSQSF